DLAAAGGDVLVAGARRIARDVLDAQQVGVVTGVAQRPGDVVVGVLDLKAEVGQSKLAATVRPLAGDQCGAAGGTRGTRAEVLAEEDALLGQALYVRRWYSVA